MKDKKGEDEKILAIPVDDPRMEEIQSLDTIPKHLLREIEEFFDIFKHLERGKTTTIVGWDTKFKTLEIIKTSIGQFSSNKQ